MLRLKRKYNNNAALVEDERQLESIVIGNGVAFEKKAGEIVDESRIDKRFVIDSEEIMPKFLSLMQEVPANHLLLVDKIVLNAEKNLKVQFDEGIYIALADHIHYAIARARQRIFLRNIMTGDIRRFYPAIYEEALRAMKEIEYAEGLEFPEDEAAYIALHFINAMNPEHDIEFITLYTVIAAEIMKIVEGHFQVKIDVNSLGLARFETHIKFLVKRMMSSADAQKPLDADFIYEQVTKSYPDSFACALRVAAFLENDYHMKMHRDEIVYLIIHIQRVVFC